MSGSFQLIEKHCQTCGEQEKGDGQEYEKNVHNQPCSETL
jgi:hypothetical protein